MIGLITQSARALSRRSSKTADTRVIEVGTDEPVCPRTWTIADRLIKVVFRCSYLMRCGEMRAVRDEAEIDAAQRLVYREYRRRGYCAESEIGMHFSLHSLLPTCKTLILSHKGKCRGTISIQADGAAGLPCESLFSEEITALRNEGRKLAEIGLLALDQRYFRKGSYSLTSLKKMSSLFRLFRGVANYSAYDQEFTDLVIVVHPKHANLYRYIGFTTFGPVRDYDGAEGNPALPMRLDLRACLKDLGRTPVRSEIFARVNLAVFQPQQRYTLTKLCERLAGHPYVWASLSAQNRAALFAAYPALGRLSDLLDRLHECEAGEKNDSVQAVTQRSAIA